MLSNDVTAENRLSPDGLIDGRNLMFPYFHTVFTVDASIFSAVVVSHFLDRGQSAFRLL